MRRLAFIVVFIATPAAALDFEDYVRCATFEQAIDLFRRVGKKVDRRNEDLHKLAARMYDQAMSVPVIQNSHYMNYNDDGVILGHMNNGDMSPQLANALFACKQRVY